MPVFYCIFRIHLHCFDLMLMVVSMVIFWRFSAASFSNIADVADVGGAVRYDATASSISINTTDNEYINSIPDLLLLLLLLLLLQLLMCMILMIMISMVFQNILRLLMSFLLLLMMILMVL